VKAFAYVDAASESEAVSALSPRRGQVLPLAGGMDLVGLMKDYVAQPDRVVNVKRLDGAITESGDGLRIGAAVTLTELIEHPAAARLYPALVQAAAEVGSPQIRNVGTLGGNLAQRPRCWYFRNEEFHCLKKGGASCFAVEGENQFHAIFGEGPCHIVHPSNMAVPLMAYRGTVRVVGPRGEREVSADQLFVMPDRNLWSEIAIEPDELITHVALPASAAVKSATYEVRFKQSHDWPLGLASVALTMDANTVRAASVVLGAVAPIPWRATGAETILVGEQITDVVAERAAEAAVQGARPMSQNAYKVQIARTAVKRAILKAAGLNLTV